MQPQCRGMERMALLCPLLPTSLFPVLHSLSHLLTQFVNNKDRASNNRLVVFFIIFDLNKAGDFLQRSLF